jgi:D-sedoheptulose 7-phosphate isomerase
MDHYRIIAENFQDTVETVTMSVDRIADDIERGSRLMVEALLSERKVITCGNGVDAVLAQLLTCNMIDRFEADRPALPALTLGADNTSLTAIARNGGYDDIFSRQLQALGQAGDVLLCINTSDGVDNLLRAARTAKERNIAVIALSHAGDEGFRSTLGAGDVLIEAGAARRARLVELYTMVIHSFCSLIDYSLFGAYNRE